MEIQTLLLCFYIMVIHTIADFFFQTEEMAMNKSTSNGHLFNHVAVYVTMWVIGASTLFWFDCETSIFGKCVDAIKVLKFAVITFVSHFITDYISSRISKKKFDKKEYYTRIPNFGGAFSVIQIDQLAHYAQLFATYYLIKQNVI